MRVAALAPLAAMLVSLANAAPVPNADPLSLCFFGFGFNCGPSTTSTSVAAVKTTSSSVIPSSTVKTTSSVATSSAASSKASSVVASPTTKAATTTAVANWTWLWDPAYIFNMWNNYNGFRWDKYNDCSFNGYSLTYVKAWYWQTYGFQPMTGCQWADVHNFLAKYAVKTSIAPASTQKYTPGCANPFDGLNVGWKPASSSSAASSTKATSASAVATSKAVSSSVPVSSASVAASSVRSSSAAASQSVAQSPAAASQSVAQSSAAASQSVAQTSAAASQSSAASSSASQAASSSAASSAASQAASSSVASSAASQAASSSAAQSSEPASSSAQAAASTAQSSAAGPDASSQASQTDSGLPASNTGSASDSGSPTSVSASAPASSPTSSAITGTPVILSNGKVVQSIGCVAEVDGRKFTAASFDDASIMTNEWCSNWCSNLGYPVSGTQYAQECYCSGLDKLSSYTVSDQCVMPCSGDASGSSICGGPQALSVLIDMSASRTVALPSNWVARGCYQDNSSRVLTYQAYAGKADNTLESCAAQCSSLGYNIAGSEYGSECFCGNTFVGGPVAIDSGRCDMPCSGNGGDKCGGSFSLTVASLSGAF